jgi:hypothetical protein
MIKKDVQMEPVLMQIRNSYFKMDVRSDDQSALIIFIYSFLTKKQRKLIIKWISLNNQMILDIVITKKIVKILFF